MNTNFCPQNTIGYPQIFCFSFKGIILLCIVFYMIFLYTKTSYETKKENINKIKILSKSLNNKNNDLKMLKIKNKYYKKNLNNTYNNYIKKIVKNKENDLENNHVDFENNEPRKVQINIKTRGNNDTDQQHGTLTKLNFSNQNGPGTSSDSIIIPLMGRRPYNRSHKMIYYTIYNNMRIPLKNKNRDCDSEYGCDELFTDDVIEIPELNGQFKVNIYKNQALQYIPY